MICSQQRDLHVRGFARKGPCFVRPAGEVQARGEIHQGVGQVTSLGASTTLEDLDGPPIQALCFLLSLLPIQDRAERSEIAPHVGMLGAEGAYSNRQTVPSEGLGR